jgi:hypothetical protein
VREQKKPLADEVPQRARLGGMDGLPNRVGAVLNEARAMGLGAGFTRQEACGKALYNVRGVHTMTVLVWAFQQSWG